MQSAFEIYIRLWRYRSDSWARDLLHYFLTFRILFHQEKPFNHRYDFIFDRCRAVRQEIVIQNLSCDETVQLLQPIVMFLSLSVYRLIGSPIAVFDPKISRQHLQECLLKCLTCYDVMDRLGNREYSIDKREIIEGIYLMLNMDDNAALQRAIRLDASVKKTFIISKSIDICLNFHMRSFFKVFKEIQELPHLLCAIASLTIPRLRREMFHMFSIAYNSSTLTVPFDYLQRLLIYDELELLLRDLKSLGILDENDQNPKTVVFSRTKFNSSKSIVSQRNNNKLTERFQRYHLTEHSAHITDLKLLFSLNHFFLIAIVYFQSSTSLQFIEHKLRDYHIPDLICLKTL